MKCKRCGKEMELVTYSNGDKYWVCHDCRVRRKIKGKDINQYTGNNQIKKNSKLYKIAFVLFAILAILVIILPKDSDKIPDGYLNEADSILAETDEISIEISDLYSEYGNENIDSDSFMQKAGEIRKELLDLEARANELNDQYYTGYVNRLSDLASSYYDYIGEAMNFVNLNNIEAGESLDTMYADIAKERSDINEVRQKLLEEE